MQRVVVIQIPRLLRSPPWQLFVDDEEELVVVVVRVVVV
jgi:hypothetical protein